MLDQTPRPRPVPLAPAPPHGISAEIWAPLWHQAHLLPGLERWLLEHGTVFVSSTLASQLGVPGQCFKNAGSVALGTDELLYCEGLAASADVPLMFPHAWLVDRQGQAVEVTWPAPGRAYLGAVFQTRAYVQILEETRLWGVFDMHAPAWVTQEPQRWKHPSFEGMGVKVPGAPGNALAESEEA